MLALLALTLTAICEAAQGDIDRHAIVIANSPQLHAFDLHSPFTLGNGQFAFTADVTGLQSFGNEYFAAGFPLETKARWAWHSKPGDGYNLVQVAEEYAAYGHQVAFPTRLDTPAAEWLRQNPHDLPLGRIALLLDGKKPEQAAVTNIRQQLDLWEGTLHSHYDLADKQVAVTTIVPPHHDAVSFRIRSPLIGSARLSVQIRFPRSYDFAVKNTPDMDWEHDDEHTTRVRSQTRHSMLLERKVDDRVFAVSIHWRGNAVLKQNASHDFELVPSQNSESFEFTIEYLEHPLQETAAPAFLDTQFSATRFWNDYWLHGAFADFGSSTNEHAKELQRRILLSQYLLAVQSRSVIPPQETGLTSSSWYGKLHTEMAWWHNAHWILWNRSDASRPMLDWYLQHLDPARTLASERGLQGARWPQMTGPDTRESPGDNALIIWNQPQPIHLAEMLYLKTRDRKVLEKYAPLVEASAQALSSMLSWDAASQRFVLDPPIWISQEIYPVRESRNPGFELAYWRYGLITAQAWRQRLGLPANALWQEQIEKLAELPVKDGKYVAMESIPDTFDHAASRTDHPSMLAASGILNDPRVDHKTMSDTLDAVIKHWGFSQNIWGWDYPMMAMTAARLNRPDLAVELLLMDNHNNHYMINGNVPQQGAELPVYLPANAALLTAVAVMLEKDPHTGKYIGFPDNEEWDIRTEGF